jgi:class 3 adenylate cyclase/Tfp pilus assembly protein PilE
MANETTPNTTVASLERRLATILCADVAGYSNMMGANEEQTVQVFRGHREIFESLVNLHRGRIFNTAGDALLVEFNSAVEAVRCATEIQAALATRNEHLAPGEKMLFRIGINLGDVIVQGGDLLGDGVNVAARIQTGTEPGGIRISGSVYDQIQNKLSLGFKLLGEQTYKNIAKPVRTYSISEGAVVTAPAPHASTKIWAAIAAALLVIAGAAYWGYQEYAARREEQAQLMAQLAAQKEATEQAQRAAEDAKRDALLQTQKQAAEETLRRAQEERNRLAQDRKAIESERRAADAQKQTAILPASPVASKSLAQYDGIYNGRLCNHFQERPPACRPVALVVRNGTAEGSWTTVTNKTSTVKGTVDASGALKLIWANWTPAGKLLETNLTGRIVDHAITASGQWRNGVAISGNWKRAQ